MARYFEEVVAKSDDVKRSISFINTVLMKHLKEDLLAVDAQKVTSEMMGELVFMVKSGEISNNAAKGEVFDEMYKTGKTAKVVVEEKGLKQVRDSGAIESAC